jgi:hypothetical protein
LSLAENNFLTQFLDSSEAGYSADLVVASIPAFQNRLRCEEVIRHIEGEMSKKIIFVGGW